MFGNILFGIILMFPNTIMAYSTPVAHRVAVPDLPKRQ